MRTWLTTIAHNLAVVFWITANAWWMTAEFFGFDESPVWLGVDGRHLALIPFLIGALVLLRHYAGEWIAREVLATSFDVGESIEIRKS